ncbi:alcohol dehydrogenase [Eggerthellaceae bacterium 3-80]|nr:alcohol dehydrogenase [bacterium D16-34]
MDSRQREKIALIVFALLVVLSVCGLCWYLIAGHSWNVAASNIDDTFGEMDGYTAIVFPGTVDPKLVDEDLETQDSVNKRINPARESDSANKEDNPKQPLSSTMGKQGSMGENSSSSTHTQPITLESVKDSYQEKGASVFELYTDNLVRYEDGTILKREGHRYGVFSVDSLMPYKAIEDKIAYFDAYNVDFIVAITPSTALVSRISGIDIVITTSNEKLFAMGETIDGTFYVNAPLKGEVGVILISPSNVVSAKVVS